MEHITGIARNQMVFSSLEDTILPYNLVRFIDAFANNIDFAILLGTTGKKTERERKNGIRLGVDQDHAYAWSLTRKGGWAIAQTPILSTTITLQRMKKRGYQSLTYVYIELNPWLCEPPYTRVVRTVV